jgi:hypothetical protein
MFELLVDFNRIAEIEFCSLITGSGRRIYISNSLLVLKKSVRAIAGWRKETMQLRNCPKDKGVDDRYLDGPSRY